VEEQLHLVGLAFLLFKTTVEINFSRDTEFQHSRRYAVFVNNLRCLMKMLCKFSL